MSSRPVGIATLAAKHGVTARTVRNWVRRGLPFLSARPYLFDPAAAAAWAAQFIGHETLGHGGKRPRAGRPRRGTSRATPKTQRLRRGTDAAAESPLPPTTPTSPTSPTSPTPPTPTRHLSEEAMERALAEGTATAAEIDLFRERLRLLAQLRADRRERGLLLEASEVESTWLHVLAGLRSALEQAPSQVSTRSAAELGLHPTLEVPLRRIAEEVLQDAMLAIFRSTTPTPTTPTTPPPPPPAPPASSPAAASPASSPPPSA